MCRIEQGVHVEVCRRLYVYMGLERRERCEKEPLVSNASPSPLLPEGASK